MHPELQHFIVAVKSMHPEFFENKKVLEVGSLDINGSIRPIFKNCDYTGLDLGPGPGVDVICPIHEFNPGYKFDVVISTEMLEHDKYWVDSLRKMYNLTKPNGLFILTCAGPARQEHGTTRTTPGDAPFTNDYYRNISVEDFETILNKDLFLEYSLGLYRANTDLYFYGIKKAEV